MNRFLMTTWWTSDQFKTKQWKFDRYIMVAQRKNLGQLHLIWINSIIICFFARALWEQLWNYTLHPHWKSPDSTTHFLCISSATVIALLITNFTMSCRIFRWSAETLIAMLHSSIHITYRFQVKRSDICHCETMLLVLVTMAHSKY